jgi:apolipoprotein N-acyltransferase
MIYKLLLAAISGATCVLGWAPYNLPWLAVGAYALLFAIVFKTRSIAQAALLGGVHAITLHAVGSSWVLEAILHRANAGLFFAILGTGVFLIYLALFTTVGAMLFRWILPMPNTDTSEHIAKPTYLWLAVISFAAVLTLSEFARSLFFNGYTPLSLGYVFVDGNTRAFIPLGGVYLASFVGYLWAGFLASCFLSMATGHWLRHTLSHAFFASALWYAAILLDHYEWVQPYDKPLTFRLIQGNIKQDDKFKPEKIQAQINQYVDTIMAQPAELIVTPETALPVFLHELSGDTLERLKSFSSSTGSHIFLGIATLSSAGKGHNSVLQVAPTAAQLFQYDKIRLMPFGEYSPYGFGWFSSQLHIALKDLVPGATTPEPFKLQTNQPNSTYLIGSLVCHEDMLGDDLRHWLPKSHILLNPSNLAWFDGTIALAQRAQMAQGRALEAGRPLLRVTNTGISAHIDHLGRIRQYAGEGKSIVVTGSVQAMQGSTPYATYNNRLLIIALISISVVCAVTVRKVVVS